MLVDCDRPSVSTRGFLAALQQPKPFVANRAFSSELQDHRKGRRCASWRTWRWSSSLAQRTSCIRRSSTSRLMTYAQFAALLNHRPAEPLLYPAGAAQDPVPLAVLLAAALAVACGAVGSIASRTTGIGGVASKRGVRGILDELVPGRSLDFRQGSLKP